MMKVIIFQKITANRFGEARKRSYIYGIRKKKVMDIFEERKEIVQDVIDRLLLNPKYKQELLELNTRYQGAIAKKGAYRVMINPNIRICQ